VGPKREIEHDEGFCVIEVRFDEAQRPVDYRFLETNSGFYRQSKLSNVQGRWMRDLAPDLEQHWLDIYGRVALTGNRCASSATLARSMTDGSTYSHSGSMARSSITSRCCSWALRSAPPQNVDNATQSGQPLGAIG
jgi:hypothetical protein